MLMRRVLWDGIKLSADLGGGGGGDAGASAAAPAPAAGADAGTTDAGQAQAFDYDGLAQQFGGPEGLQQAAMFARDIHLRGQYNPQFKQTLERALRGEFGPEAQQQAQDQQRQQGGPQQPQQGQGQPWLKYEPATVAQMQSFHRDLQRARESGDEQAVQMVMNDPMNKEAAETYFRHQKEMNGSYWDPRGFHTKMWQDPEMQQLRQQEYEQQMQPVMQQMNHGLKTLWYQSNQKAVDGLPENIRQAFMQGFYGAGPDAPFTEWVQAIQKAMQHAQQQAAGGQPPANVAQNATPQQPGQRPPQRAPVNGVRKPEKDGFDEKAAIEQFASARTKERLAQKS